MGLRFLVLVLAKPLLRGLFDFVRRFEGEQQAPGALLGQCWPGTLLGSDPGAWSLIYQGLCCCCCERESLLVIKGPFK